jgi:hypothetical protein
MMAKQLVRRGGAYFPDSNWINIDFFMDIAGRTLTGIFPCRVCRF